MAESGRDVEKLDESFEGLKIGNPAWPNSRSWEQFFKFILDDEENWWKTGGIILLMALICTVINRQIKIKKG